MLDIGRTDIAFQLFGAAIPFSAAVAMIVLDLVFHAEIVVRRLASLRLARLAGFHVSSPAVLDRKGRH